MELRSSRVATARAVPSRFQEKDLKAELGSVALFALALFSLAAILTYSPSDPGFFSSSNAEIQNSCGKVGAYLASLMLQCFGLGSFLLPAALGFVSASVYKREGGVRIIGTLGGMTIAVSLQDAGALVDQGEYPLTAEMEWFVANDAVELVDMNGDGCADVVAACRARPC